jgi:hypothetical protein
MSFRARREKSFLSLVYTLFYLNHSHQRYGELVFDHDRAVEYLDKSPPAWMDGYRLPHGLFALIDSITSLSSRAAISRPPNPTARATATAMAPSSNPNAKLMMSLATPI